MLGTYCSPRLLLREFSNLLVTPTSHGTLCGFESESHTPTSMVALHPRLDPIPRAG